MSATALTASIFLSWLLRYQINVFNRKNIFYLVAVYIFCVFACAVQASIRTTYSSKAQI